MRPVIILTGLMIGVLLIVVSAEMTRQRDSHDPTDILLMTAIRDGRDSVYLVGADDGDGAWRAIGPKYAAFSPKGRSPDGKWVYLMESNYNNTLNIPYAENMRVRTNGAQAQRLAGVNISGAMFWMGEWVYYQNYDINTGASDLYRAQPDGGQVENLTANFQWSVNVGQYSPPVFDPNGAWIMFNASDLNGMGGIFRLDLVTGQISELIPQSAAYIMLLGTSADGAWLVLRIEDVLYHIRPDGSQLGPIFNNGGGYVTVWARANLVLANTYAPDGSTWLYAVGIADGRVYWQLPNVYPDAPPTQSIIFLRDSDNWLYQALADGTPPRRLLQLPQNTLSLVQSPNGRWVLLVQGENYDATPNSVTYKLWLMRLADGALVERYRHANYFAIVGWADDESAVFVEGYDNGERDLWRIDLASGSKTRLIHGERYGYFLGVVGERKWGAWLCVPLGGIGLIGAGMGSWLWGRRKHGSTLKADKA